MQAKTESTFWSQLWFEKMAIKIKIIREVILLNLQILLFDSDVVLMNNPLPPILNHTSYDIIAQKDKFVCAGFMFELFSSVITRFVNATYNSYTFLNRVLKTMRTKQMSDQPSINYLLQHHIQPSLRVLLLPEHTFSSGRVFFASHQFQWDRISEEQTIIHNNYVLGYANKLYRLKEMGLYQLDQDGEYSSNSTSFLILDELFGERADGEWWIEKEKETLRIAVELANRLNRSLVLPVFRCVPSIQLPFCNACGNEEFHCHRDVLRNAIRPWKEHVELDVLDEWVDVLFKSESTRIAEKRSGECRTISIRKELQTARTTRIHL